jgi:hypothetical protein
LLDHLSGALRRTPPGASSEIRAEDLFAYVYGVLAGTDDTTRFLEELETPGPRVPLTAERELFHHMRDLGANLLWLHTYGERFTGEDRGEGLTIPDEIDWYAPVTRLPDTPAECRYDGEAQTLHVADGALGGVRQDVRTFEVSGMPVVKKWLGYRTRGGAGRAASSQRPLDRIRPAEWHDSWSLELRELVHVLTVRSDHLPAGTQLLEQICEGPLIAAGAFRRFPRSSGRCLRCDDAATS